MNQKKWNSFLLIQPNNASENIKTARKFIKPLTECKKVLDVGCGEGITLSLLKEKGISSVGITLSKDDSTKVQLKRNNVVIGDMHELPFKDKSFDGVYCKDAFEHSISPFIASKEFSRVLKKNGKLVLVIPKEEWLKEYYHFHYFTPFQLTTLLSKNNLFLKKAGFDLFFDFYVFEKNEKKKIQGITLIELNHFFWNVLRRILSPFLKFYFKHKK